MTLPRFSLFDPLSPGVALIEASAGTGKTYSIAALVVRMFAELDLRAEQLLVVTFTRAATAELADRIRARLFEAGDALRRRDGGGDAFLVELVARAEATDATQTWAQRIERARANLDAATIATIHSFANRALQWFSLEAGHDNQGEPLDSVEGLVDSIVNDLQIAIAGVKDGGLNPLELGIEGLERTTLRRVVAAAIDEPRAIALPTHIEALDVDGFRAALGGAWERYAAAVRDAGVHAFAAVPLELMKKVLNAPARVPIETHWPGSDATAHDLLSLLGVPSSCRAAWSLAMVLRAGVVLSNLNARQRGAREVISPLDPVLEAGDRLFDATTRATSGLLAGVVDDARERMHTLLAQRGATIHSGQLVALADAIESDDRGPLLTRRLGERFAAVLIDEFQDTDALQWTIFERAFASTAIVRLIGDPKQAIYRFRGADFKVYDVAARSASQRSTMTTNYRSDARLVGALNLLLSRPGAFRSDTIDYVAVTARERQPECRLRDATGAPLSGVAFRVFDGTLVGEARETVPNKTKLGLARERLVAADIARLLGSAAEIFDGQAWRTVRPSDIAVLVDSHDQAQAVRKHLAALRIPAVTRGTQAVFATDEARWMLQLLQTMQHPTRRRELKRLAAGQLWGWTAHDLLSSDESRWNELAATLRQAQLDWTHRGLLAAIRPLFARHDVEARVIASEGGERSLTNLHHLLELLHRASHEEKLGPDALLAWLNARIRRAVGAGRPGPDDPALLRLETDAAAVQVMTLHASKGLEFGIVYLTRLADVRDDRHERIGEKLRVTSDGIERGIWCDRSDPYAEAGHFAQTELLESKQEEVRRLYVGVTRARHRLVVYAGLIRSNKQIRVIPESPLWTLISDERREAGWPAFAEGDDTTDALENYLVEVAQHSGGTIDVSRVDDALERVEPLPAQRGNEPLQRAVFSRRGDLRNGWGMLSFSSMARSLKTHARSGIEALEGEIELYAQAARDRDGDSEAGEGMATDAIEGDGVEATALVTTGFDALRAGRTAGDVIHGVLEVVDFTEAREHTVPPSWIGVLAREAARQGVQLTDVQVEALVGDLARTCRAPIDAGGVRFSLSDVTLAQRRSELEFTIALKRGRLGGVAPLVETFEDRRDDPAISLWLARLSAMPLAVVEGMLTGFIDLVCAVDGADGEPRYLVIDYKTNRLHPTTRDGNPARFYQPDALRVPMADHHYVLQYHIYVVALHRLLRRTLGTRYDYDRHVGGAAYLFVRGMAMRDAAEQTGVFFDRPPRQTIERLSALLDGGRS